MLSKSMVEAEEAKAKDQPLLNPQVRALLQQMLDQSSFSIRAKIDNKGISYPAISPLLPNKTDAEVRNFLHDLVKAGILAARLLDKVIVCPTCSGAIVYSRYNCPRCGSFDIIKTSIVECVQCGCIGSVDKFERGDRLICPKCKHPMTEADYKKIGKLFECNSCGSRFEAPKINHKCGSCDDVFTYKEAEYQPVFEYTLTEEAKKSIISGQVPLNSMAAALKENGFVVQIKAELVGKSGATHTFDIIARKGEQLIVANFTFDPKEEDIIGLFAKKYDIDPTYTLLISLSPPSKEEEAVSKAYGVKILSASPGVSVVDVVLKLIDSSSNKT